MGEGMIYFSKYYCVLFTKGTGQVPKKNCLVCYKHGSVPKKHDPVRVKIAVIF